MAEPIPIRRSDKSGVSNTLFIARLAASGKAAKIRPSMTKTSPNAAKKSVMPLARVRYREGAGAAGAAVELSRGLPNGSLK